MSINVTITLPLPTATAIQQGDFDKAYLSQLVLDAVKALPLLGGPSFSHQDPFTSNDGALTPPALSTYDPEVVTVRDGYASRATSPPVYTPNPTEYESSSRTVVPDVQAVRYPDRDSFKVDKFPVTVIHEGKGVWPIHVNSAMTGAELAVLIEEKSGVEVGRQRVKFNESLLEMEKTLYASGIRRHRQLHLIQLSGLVLLDSDVDFWIHVKGCVSEKKIPIHAKLSTSTTEVGMALFEHFAPHTPFGRRQVKFKGQPVYGVNEVVRTMEHTAADYLHATTEPQPAEETGLGTHFTNTFSKEHKETAPNQPPEVKLKDTNSGMTTAQLQQAASDAQQADPNILKKMKIVK
ncbi:hypothetical protein M409DRAFT_16322 [Zasmidium cellare ATCC 36951]|uniref:Ubiquitin-like domain-containing protein n=1 Tax=Zasmidium cellare ATCC 36951 TaxID=1080233 RepID=A0A6A6D3T7_ZASCE|nr:uncharacterized protein M409DRAFT_16322 [Zasmidium cellare ATCC 36951]KAF2174047.1 hypothetical protein M409DRAFT_16322 [Zasmidium cellare ATCC 36951]